MIAFLVTLLIVLYVSSFVHELGHAVMGRLSGYLVTSFGLGTARPMCVLKWGLTRVYFGFGQPFQGLAFSFSPQLYPSRYHAAGLLAGGILAQALVAVLAVPLYFMVPWGEMVWLTIAGVNGLSALINLIPLSGMVKNFPFPSDGAQILQVLRRGTVEEPAPVRIQGVRALRGLWEATGDMLGLYVHLMGMAGAWLELGDHEQADEVCNEAELLPVEKVPVADALWIVLRGLAARGAGRLEDCGRALEEAEQRFRALNHEAGLFLTAWVRAELLLFQKRPDEALIIMDQLFAHRLAQSRPHLPVALTCTEVCVRAALPDQDGLEDSLRRYESRRRQHPAPTRDLIVYRVMAAVHAEKQNWEEARRWYERSLDALVQLYNSFADPADQARLLHCQAELLQGARTCLRELGQDEAAVDARFPTPEELAQRRTAAAQRSERGLLWWAWGFQVTNLAAALVILVMCPNWESMALLFRYGRPYLALGSVLFTQSWWGYLLASLLFCGALAGFGAILCIVAKRFWAWLQGKAARGALFLAAVPWVSWGALDLAPRLLEDPGGIFPSSKQEGLLPYEDEDNDGEEDPEPGYEPDPLTPCASALSASGCESA